MIPKVIHYIWLGGKPLPKFIKKCMKSWKKYCPDYEIKRWDETNLNLGDCQFAKDAYESKKYAFASDFFRFQILYNEGGIYLDVDVELVKPIDDLLKNECFTGFEIGGVVAPGLIFGANKGDEVCKEIMQAYHKQKFNIDNLKNSTVCVIVTKILQKRGLKCEDKDQEIGDIKVFSSEYFCPKKFKEKEINITPKTYSIHHYYGSWVKKEPLYKRIKWWIGDCVKCIIGEKNFNKLRKK